MAFEADQPGTSPGTPRVTEAVPRAVRSGAPRSPSVRFWPELLARLEKGRVIPVVGPDAVVVGGELGDRPLAEYVARRAEAELGLEPTPPEQRTSPHEVACRYVVEGRGQLAEVYGVMKSALDQERPAAPPPALLKLAGIRAFKLYVTTTFDDLLKWAIDQTRHGGAPRTKVLTYSPENVQDIPTQVAKLPVPYVYHLLGMASPLEDYVVTEEDTLEFVHSLQSENKSPKTLLDELQSYSLLIIGSGYPDWLSRFFLRLAKPERLLLAQSKPDYMADSRTRDDKALGDFLRQFNARTTIIDADALTFIDQLADRWKNHEPASRADDAPNPSRENDQESEADHPIFLSYAHEDAADAQLLHDALRAAGCPVWMDKSGGLEPGDDYKHKIEERIEHASLFVPIVSPTALRTTGPRFFWLEWRLASDAAERMAPSKAFIVPVLTAGVDPNDREIPDAFRSRTAGDLRGNGLDAIVQRLKTLYRNYQLALRGR
jgi:TIR domain-containing protein/SIR2-like protein